MSIDDTDIRMMRRALRLAMNGRGHVEPNPMVGCVLVNEGRVIGEGYHAKFGGPHAEPMALAAASESPRGATAYVTLEPCCHTNKKTPPCVPALIAAGIKRVLIGSVDPNPDVNGKGADQLRAAGIDVTVNVLEDPAKQLLAPFIASNVYQRPYMTLKWAETADGKIAGAGGRRLQISNPAAWRLVHALRSRSDAILIGIGTALSDDPQLTVREVPPLRQPVRIVLDTHLRLPANAKLLNGISDGDVVVYCSKDAARRIMLNDADRLRSAGAGVVAVDLDEHGRVSLERVIEDLGRQFVHLLVEPGPTLAQSFFEYGLVDRIWQIRSPKRADDPSAPAAAGIPGNYVRSGQLDIAGDTLAEYLNPASPVFFAAEPSADLVLAREA